MTYAKIIHSKPADQIEKFQSRHSLEKNIAALYRLFNYKTQTLVWRRTAPTGFELGTINENNTQFTMKLRFDQSFTFFTTILKSFFNIVPLCHAYKELRIEFASAPLC